MTKNDTLGVFLEANAEEIRVGTLTRFERDMVRFDIDEAYIDMGEYRPIFSSALLRYGNEEETVQLLRDAPMTRSSRDIPTWFSNLLPEGALKAMVLKGMPSGETTDFDVLSWLGEDLPGAVIVRSEDGGKQQVVPPALEDGQTGIRFSLAGVQLKMSMLKQDERLTFPAMGVNGNIIAKVPSEKYRSLPEVEFASMKLAEAVGVEIPHVELVPVSAISGIDPELLKGGDTVLAVDRFDRTNDGRRVHMEDFMQILDQHPDRKYTAANEETVLNVATRLGGGGTEPFLQAIRRVAANILMGNTDAHLKNWSLYYPNPAEGQLSPAYDIVASHIYDRSHDMALKFRKTHDSRIIGLPRFLRAAEFCGISQSRTKKELKRVVEQAADEWPKLLQNLPMPDDFARLVIARTHELALVQEFDCVFADIPPAPGS